MATSKFAIGISIGAALAPAFTSTIASSQSKINGLAAQIKGLSTQKIAVAELQKYKTELARLEARAKIAGANTGSLRKEIIAAKEGFKAATVKAHGLGVATGKLESEEKRLNAAIKSTNMSLKARNTLADQKDFRAGAMGGILDAAAPAVAMAVPVMTAVGFEQAMAEVGAVSNASDAQLKQLTATARELGSTTSFSAVEAAQGMKYLSMAGFDTAENIAAMPGVLSLAKAGNTDLGRTADIASDMLSAFRLEAGQMGMVGDVLAKTFTTSNVTLEHLGETMKYVGPAAAAAGVSLQEASAMAGLLGDVGIKGSEAGTALRASLLRLAAPPSEAAKALDALGVATKDSEGNLRNMPEILADVAAATEDMGSADKLGYIKDIFGMEASSAMVELLNKTSSGDIKKKITLVTDSEGTSKEIAKMMDNTTAGQFKQLASAAESLQISLGTLALPFVRAAASFATAATGVLDGVVNEFPTASKVVFGVAAAFAGLPPLMLAVRMGASYLKTAKAGLTLVYSGFGKVLAFTRGRLVAYNVVARASAIATKAMAVGQRVLNAAMRANPIGLVITAVGGLVAAGVMLYKNWDTVKVRLAAAWEGIKAGAFAVWERFKTVFSWSPVGLIINGFTQAKNFLSTIDWSASGAAIMATLANGIKAAAMMPVEAVKGALADVREFLPFSDAKKGPLSTLTASGAAIPGTMAKGVASDTSLEGSMANKLQLPAVAGGRGAGGAQGGTIHINFNPTINGGDSSSVTEALQLSEARLKKMMLDIMHNERRLSYA